MGRIRPQSSFLSTDDFALRMRSLLLLETTDVTEAIGIVMISMPTCRVVKGGQIALLKLSQ
jgi:hypothetical protein